MSSNLKIVFGGMAFGKAGTAVSRVHSLDTAASLLDIFTSHGHNEIDTARIYGSGTSEEFFTELGWKSRGLVMGTKLYPTARVAFPDLSDNLKFTHSPEDLRRGLEDSLAALSTDHIDLFYLHGPDRETNFEVTLKAVNDLHQEGKFSKFGISNFAAWEVAQICEICERNGWIKPTVYQGVYNCFMRGVEAELVPCLRKYGISLYVFNPLAGGLLTGKYSREQKEVEDGTRFDNNSFSGKIARGRYWNDYFFGALEKLTPVAEKNGLTVTECALRWLTHHSILKKEFGDAVIVGASGEKHLKENLADLEKGPLPEDVVEAIEEGWATVRGVPFKYFH
ncbi:Aflatoxin B1 aldehyde reductase member 2 [Arthrobotrys musiformis]|uniref:Aflatoxin B1 aldehyde reductase member 2 n=1 Tax=Arthrobotrys musiformis TaxID=47236 RepID=A0AAV9W027_9PEZI